MQVVRVANQTRGTVIAEHVQVAATSLQRAVGLLGRRNLDPGKGLWIRPSSGVHTFGMRFAIDVVGLDAELSIVRLWPHLAPHRLTALRLRVKSVIELPAGTIAASQSCVGDRIGVG